MHTESDLQLTMSESDTDILAIADEIRRYLSAHPNAADSRDGVLRWWLTRQRIEESADAVQRALDHLVELGLIRVERLADGTVVFSCRSN
jgi:hypothetical protein